MQACSPGNIHTHTHTDGRAFELQLPQSNILALSSCYYIYTYHIIMKIKHAVFVGDFARILFVVLLAAHVPPRERQCCQC